jgi:DNA-binding HxlR family transcriptional regulator
VRHYECGLDAAMDVIEGKWKVLILWALTKGPQRFGELRRLLPGASEKVLAEHLKQMVADGIVLRESFPETVLRVEYSLTPLGQELNEALGPLGAWGTKHLTRLVNR